MCTPQCLGAMVRARFLETEAFRSGDTRAGALTDRLAVALRPLVLRNSKTVTHTRDSAMVRREKSA
jgi:hypothetical protein